MLLFGLWKEESAVNNTTRNPTGILYGFLKDEKKTDVKSIWIGLVREWVAELCYGTVNE